MRSRAFLTALVGLLVLSAVALQAVGTTTRTTSYVYIRDGEVNLRLYKHTVAWTSSAGGAVSANPFTAIGTRVVQIRIVPGTGGVAPDDDYDVSLLDASGIDLLNGQGADADTTLGEYLMFNPPILLGGTTLDVVIVNAGNANSGTVEVWVQ